MKYQIAIDTAKDSDKTVVMLSQGVGSELCMIESVVLDSSKDVEKWVKILSHLDVRVI